LIGRIPQTRYCSSVHPIIPSSHHPTERKDDYHLLGHSWGTILAQLFVLNAPTESLKGLASMVLAGPLPLGVRKVIPDWYETVVIYEVHYYEWQSICPCVAGRIIPDPS
jgi:pimeloyl-ACP methyl ester carboxylesterase